MGAVVAGGPVAGGRLGQGVAVERGLVEPEKILADAGEVVADGVAVERRGAARGSAPVGCVALAEFIRELIVAGTRDGLAAARARGRTGGRPTVITPELLRAARDMLPNPENSITSIAKLLGVSPGTLYNHIPDLQHLRESGKRADLTSKLREHQHGRPRSRAMATRAPIDWLAQPGHRMIYARFPAAS
ncbi:hypothetical protein [Nonomuraea basaltis]|uniref:hypothetical protein n=1 Tax=Nonomuraea basaltis TaxID=2495887 RepID=UPI0023F0DD38|nr:hypothetical protein [Nonomuraea basaltis]